MSARLLLLAALAAPAPASDCNGPPPDAATLCRLADAECRSSRCAKRPITEGVFGESSGASAERRCVEACELARSAACAPATP